MKKITYFTLLILNCSFLIACSGNDDAWDASGMFETIEVMVSAEQTGKLLSFDVEEGNTVQANQQVGLIDTVQLYLKAEKLGATKLIYSAQKNAYSAQKPEIETQLAVLRQQLANAEQDVARFKALVKDGAANKKNLDDAENQAQVIRRQIAALQSSLNTSTQSLDAQMSTADAQMKTPDIEKLQVIDQLRKCHIFSPITGIVLEKYVEPGEFASVGKPLFKVSNINDIKLRAYITADQLTKIKLGQKVTVLADQGEKDSKQYQGTISWISSKAEFTPKTIQTRDERANLVYAIKVSVKNDGLIKDGMYGEVKF